MKFHFQIDSWQASSKTVDGDWQVDGPTVVEPLTADETVTIPKMLSRRLGKVPKQVAVGAASMAKANEATYVVCSRHGDFERVLRLLRGLAEGDGVSPTDFSLSVHNMLAGVLSIAANNRHAHTAMAAGPETFAFGMMEALTLLESGHASSVLLLFFDKELPGEYAELDDTLGDQTLTLAVMLSVVDEKSISASGRSVMAELLPGQTGAIDTFEQAEAFIRFLKNPEKSETSRGSRIGWRWSAGEAEAGAQGMSHV